MVPFAILALVGLVLAACQWYRLSFWKRANTVYVTSTSLVLVKGNSTDHSYYERHHQFARADGAEVHLYFVQRQSDGPVEKSMSILYDPSVGEQIRSSEGSRWDRASNVQFLLSVGLVMAVVGLLPCLVGAALLVREWLGTTGSSRSRQG
jgi:hypothetical protein